MKEPYFKVSEEVILQSKMLPQFNGVSAIILGREIWSGFYKPLQQNITMYAYTLDFKHGVEEYSDEWAEFSLRKKPKPYNGEQFDFSEEDCPYLSERAE